MSLLDEVIAAEKYTSPSWSPKSVGDLIAGKCVGCRVTDTRNGAKLLIRVDATNVVQDGVELEPGTYSVWERAQLKQIVLDKQLREGDEVALRYVGEEKTSQGGKKKTFAAVVRHTSDSLPWVEPKAAQPESKGLPKADDFDDDIPI
jgi:hypothetical protein